MSHHQYVELAVSRKPPSFAVARNCGMGSSSLNADVKACPAQYAPTAASSAVRLLVRLLEGSKSALEALACAVATSRQRTVSMNEPGINQLPHVALFLPFSCNERRQVGASASKQNRLEVIEETRKIGAYRESATTCKSLQNGSSQGSGPGGRWFESTRPDHPIFQ